MVLLFNDFQIDITWLNDTMVRLMTRRPSRCVRRFRLVGRMEA
jgi:hypothetical protein